MLRWQRSPGRGGTFHGGSAQPCHVLARDDHYAKNIQWPWWHCNLWWLVTAIPDGTEGDWQVRKQRAYNLFQEFSYRRKCRRGRSLRWIRSLFRIWWEGAQVRDVSPDLYSSNLADYQNPPQSPGHTHCIRVSGKIWESVSSYFPGDPDWLIQRLAYLGTIIWDDF